MNSSEHSDDASAVSPLSAAQIAYEKYYSKESRAQRSVDYEAERHQIVSNAMKLYDGGDCDGAREILFNAGIDPDCYLANW